MHCTSEYPTPIKCKFECNTSVEKKFEIDVGYSDHTKGYQVALGAVVMGAKVIENISLDRKQYGPDHASSIEPKEFKYMVQSIMI